MQRAIGTSLGWLAVAILTCLAVEVGRAQAQPEEPRTPPRAARSITNADQVAVGKIRAKLVEMRAETKKVLLSGEINESSKTVLQKYVALRLDVMKAPGALNELPSEREIIKRDLRRVGGALDTEKKGLAYMNQVLLALLQEIVWDPDANRHAAVRFNCMLIIGDLNSRELALGGGGTAVPLAEAVPILMKALNDPAMNDAVKVAALVGLRRHAELGIADKLTEKQVVTDLLKLLGAKQTPTNRSEEAHVLFRRRAAELLGLIGRPGIEQLRSDVVDALLAILSDPTQPLNLRSAVARALGRFPFKAPGPNQETLAALGSLAVEATKLETSKIGYKHYFRSVQLALKGPEGQPDPPQRGMVHNLGPAQKKFVDELTKMLDDLWKASDKAVDDLQLHARMKADGAKLGEFLKQPAAAATGG